MAEVLQVSQRSTRGTANARRERAAGKIPAVLYGHGKETVNLSVPADEVQAAIRHGSHFVELKGDVDESALIRDVQWDTFGVDVLHVDFTRVDAGETAEITVSVELRGEAPGTKQGGMIRQMIHEVTIDCPVTVIPEKLFVNINSLELGGSVLAGDLELPEGANLQAEADTLVVQCVEVATHDDEEEAGVPAGPAEPEVIGRKPDEDEGGDG